jgi:hypothetical protein
LARQDGRSAATAIEESLRGLGTPQRAASEKAYLKSDLEFTGTPVLRDTAKRRPDMVAAWLEPRAHRASGVTMREAVKPLPPEVAARLLAARAGQRGRRQAR